MSIAVGRRLVPRTPLSFLPTSTRPARHPRQFAKSPGKWGFGPPKSDAPVSPAQRPARKMPSRSPETHLTRKCALFHRFRVFRMKQIHFRSRVRNFWTPGRPTAPRALRVSSQFGPFTASLRGGGTAADAKSAKQPALVDPNTTLLAQQELRAAGRWPGQFGARTFRIARQKSGKSSGLRLDTKCRSTTAGWSSHTAPALTRSSLMPGDPVTRTPR
jgi:hypothetical protein